MDGETVFVLVYAAIVSSVLYGLKLLFDWRGRVWERRENERRARERYDKRNHNSEGEE